MSTQAIKDYLVKQLFIEKNVVTYRSLSRHFGIHVNAAKAELATYHEKAPYDSQTSFATYLLTGEVLSPQRRVRGGRSSKKDADGDTTMNVDEFGEDDVGMDMFVPTQTDSNAGQDEVEEDMYEEEDEDYEDVTTINITIVNEKDLEDVRSKYHKVTSIHVYSLSPSIIHDASHLCTPTPNIRKVDNSKGPEHAAAVGRVVAPNIHVKPIKVKATPAPVAGTSKGTAQKGDDKVNDTTASKVSTSSSKPEAEDKKVPAPKKTSKANFFGDAKRPIVKKEEKRVEVEAKKPARMFFGAQPKKKAKEVFRKEEEEEEEEEAQPQKSTRGTKRKSLANELSDSETDSVSKKTVSALTSKLTSRLPSRAPSIAASKPPSSRAPSTLSATSSRRTSTNVDDDEAEDEVIVRSKAKTSLRLKKGVVLSDDEDEIPVVSKKAARKLEAFNKAILLEEKEAKEMMEIDDDRVERVSRKTDKRPKPLLSVEDDEEEESGAARSSGRKIKAEVVEEDLSMDVDVPEEEEEDEVVIQAKPKRKREKKVVPVGRNGIKKRKVTRSRTFKDEQGYMQTEDITDWESVNGDTEEEEQVKKPKAKPKATKKVKKEQDGENEKVATKDLSRAPSIASQVKEPAPSKASAKEPKPRAAAKGAAKTIPAKSKQGGIRSFFNVAQKS